MRYRQRVAATGASQRRNSPSHDPILNRRMGAHEMGIVDQIRVVIERIGLFINAYHGGGRDSGHLLGRRFWWAVDEPYVVPIRPGGGWSESPGRPRRGSPASPARRDDRGETDGH